MVESPEHGSPRPTRCEILRDFDLVVDGSDNFPPATWSTTPASCWAKPDVYGGIFRFEGQASVFARGDGPVLSLPLRRAAAARTGAELRRGRRARRAARLIGSIQALEAIKLVLGVGTPLVGRLLLFDALRLHFRELTLRKDPDCPLCGARPSIRS